MDQSNLQTQTLDQYAFHLNSDQLILLENVLYLLVSIPFHFHKFNVHNASKVYHHPQDISLLIKCYPSSISVREKGGGGERKEDRKWEQKALFKLFRQDKLLGGKGYVYFTPT